MIILGIDPGSVVTGYAVIKKEKGKTPPFSVVDFGCAVAPPGATDAERLRSIHHQVSGLLKKHRPAVMSIETVFFFKNLKTVMPVSQTKGVIMLAASQHQVPIMEFTPLQMKMAIAGYGRAEKKQVQKMIEETVDIKKFDLKKKFRKKDDAYDAIGVALCAGIKSY